MRVGCVDHDGVQLTDHDAHPGGATGPATAGLRPSSAGIRPDPACARPARCRRIGPCAGDRRRTDDRPAAGLADLAARGRAGRICSARPSPQRCRACPEPAWVAEIDDDLADTAAFTDAYGVPPEASANCVVVAARRAGQTTLAACMVLATTRADVNGLVRRHLGARKASFAPQDVAVAETGHGLRRHHAGRPARRTGRCWSTPAVAAADFVVIGSGTRGSKLAVAGRPARRACRPPRCSRASASRCARRAAGGAGPAPVAGARRQRRRLGRAPGDPADDDRRYLEDRPPHWGSD